MTSSAPNSTLTRLARARQVSCSLVDELSEVARLPCRATTLAARVHVCRRFFLRLAIAGSSFESPLPDYREGKRHVLQRARIRPPLRAHILPCLRNCIPWIVGDDSEYNKEIGCAFAAEHGDVPLMVGVP